MGKQVLNRKTPRVSARSLSVLAAAVLAFALAACKPPQNMENPAFIQFVSTEGRDLTFSTDLGKDPKDLYFVFANSREVQLSSQPTMTGSSRLDIEGGAPEAEYPMPRSRIVHRPVDAAKNRQLMAHRGSLRAGPRDVSSRAPHTNTDAVGNTSSFNESVTEAAIPVTCRYASAYFDMGGSVERKLSIWVADDCWHTSGSAKVAKVTQEMVDALAGRFLGSSSDRAGSIYSWVTNIVGAEWGSTAYNNLIAGDDTVTIVLCDINNDGSVVEGAYGGIVGYFDPTNNFSRTTYSASNERIMFFIDSVMFANADMDGSTPYEPTGTWIDTGYWPEEIYSTLAHEFQHMIHFYQKTVLRDQQGEPAWTDEMCSLVMEDLLADKIGIIGPRGVDPTDYSAGAANNSEGRIPSYNMCNYYGIGSDDYWNNDNAVLCYSTAYALGAYLARTYGGAQFVQRVVQTSEPGVSAVELAVSNGSPGAGDFKTLLRKLSVAVLLSDRTDAPEGYRFNTGSSFDSAMGSTTYRLGSINFWNYSVYDEDGTLVQSGPFVDSLSSARRRNVYSNLDIRGMMGISNVYTQAAQAETGKHEWKIDLPPNTTLTVVAR